MADRILVVGSANMDFIMRCDRLPCAGETIMSYDGYDYAAGGKGANCAVAAALLGADVSFCTRVGEDTHGKRLRKLYIDCGIDPRFVHIDSIMQTGLAVVMVEGSGSNRIVVYPGANTRVSDLDIEDAFTANPALVLTQFEIGLETVLLIAKLADKKNIPLVIDAGPARRDYPLERIPRVEIFSPNESETETLTGIKPVSVEDCLRASMALYQRTEMKYVVLKLGDRGCFVYDGKYCDLVSPFDVTAVDTTAAGDAFTAALAYKYISGGKDILRACRYANAVGALTVTKRGAAPSLPTARDVDAFLKERSVFDTAE